MSAVETNYDYASKYTKQNPLAERLIENFFSTVTGEIAKLQPQKALEVGCGEGFSTQRLAKVLPPGGLIACDLEARLVSAAKQRNPSITITEDSIYELHQPNHSYDLVMAMEVLEHLDDPAKGLRELCRVSKRWLILSVPWEPIWRVLNMARGRYLSDFGNTPGHIQHWTRSSFAKFVSQEANVRTVRGPFPWTVVVAEKR